MDDFKRYLSEAEILKITKNAMHKTFGDFGLNVSYSPRNKGGFGGFVEEKIFGYKANSDDNPDFIKAGIELKVTPVKKNQNGTMSSKERLVLNMINYQSEALATFTTSSFFKKNRKLLIWFYLYSKGVHPSRFEITDYLLLEFKNSLENKVIERDWNIIHKKIVEGNAHEISESDTEFLAACTKGANSSVLVNQYKSGIKAKPRAYSFKTSFMTYLYRNMVHNIAPYSPLISEDEWMKNPLEEIYKEKLSVYQGMTQ
ncbi:MAG: MutH/Sau3AI family endonuclease, partial [Candidatus Shapirobacteria bacterium]|nr:MutH/Sau3AI family endonuclease [Candidatus Shapirobacteria bacterium]